MGWQTVLKQAVASTPSPLCFLSLQKFWAISACGADLAQLTGLRPHRPSSGAELVSAVYTGFQFKAQRGSVLSLFEEQRSLHG